MTIKQCKEAIEIEKQIKRYKGALKNCQGRNSVETRGISTGYGTEEIALGIPISIIVERISGMIERYEKKLSELGIQDGEGD